VWTECISLKRVGFCEQVPEKVGNFLSDKDSEVS
jgi:hypothetical protein